MTKSAENRWKFSPLIFQKFAAKILENSPKNFRATAPRKISAVAESRWKVADFE